MSSDTFPRPVARQARSRETQNRILDAGIRLLEEGGPEALTVAAVAEAAGVSVGSVYRRFGDKERLLLAIQSRFTGDLAAEFIRHPADLNLAATTPPAAVIAEAVRGTAESLHFHATLMRVFILLGTHNQAVFAHGSAVSTQGGRAFRDTVMLAAPALRHHTDIEAAIDFAYRMVYATCAHRLVHGEHLESQRPLPWPDLVDQLRRAVTAYLLDAPTAASANDHQKVDH
ncbi:TetR/AcrR family transcriptional regulator [Streptomyces sp. NBC_00582]|uniref:TetR/AcrR family transcriptional regulator n=1 Tax=Streptomyces sp. NBC_00582 TaxID=2975783 RepID=UPI002E80163E|nr:TetR/AcrR family transcriptional regulator [Streptomyces sp. NBC_00582]WUB66037.1 TetR/AcrR family transcriptional regulator [Streptomyces sp. NBC_00582]